MATSTNPTIQNLMDEVEAIDTDDTSLEAKLNLIAQKIAEEQRKVKASFTSSEQDKNLIDPADAFACEGCQ